MFTVLSSWRGPYESPPGSFDECRLSVRCVYVHRLSGLVPALRRPSHVPGSPQANDITGGVSAVVPGRAELSRSGLDQAGVDN